MLLVVFLQVAKSLCSFSRKCQRLTFCYESFFQIKIFHEMCLLQLTSVSFLLLLSQSCTNFSYSLELCGSESSTSLATTTLLKTPGRNIFLGAVGLWFLLSGCHLRAVPGSKRPLMPWLMAPFVNLQSYQ